MILRPQPGPQERFLSSPADIAIFGGAAGGGKTWALLVEPLRHIQNPKFGAVIFRRTYPEITIEGGMWDEASNIYPLLGARSNQTDLTWTFPRGARISFKHLQYEHDKFDYRGAQIPLICWDQLETFSEGQFFYLFSRNRSLCGVRPYQRATCNPDPDSFLASFLAWWIDPETGYAIPERSGVLRWFVRINEQITWADTPDELQERFPNVPPNSVTFIPSKLTDNQILMEKDPSYLAKLLALPLVDRERLLNGNWKIKPAAGKLFNRGWFEIVDAVPAGGEECRFWDFAATKKTLKKKDPDSTSSVKIRKVGGIFYVLDCTEEQEGPAEVEKHFINLSKQDALAARQSGVRYKARWEIEPGSAGKRESARMTQELAGIDALGVTPQGDKIARAKPLSAQAEAGNVKLWRGAWNERWLTHMHNQPDYPHDDIMDASSGAFNALTQIGVSMEHTQSDDAQPNRWVVSQRERGETADDESERGNLRWNIG